MTYHQLDLPCLEAQEFLLSKHTCRSESVSRPVHRNLETLASLYIENKMAFYCYYYERKKKRSRF